MSVRDAAAEDLYRRAFALAAALGQVDAETAELAREQLADLDAASLTPTLAAFWLDLPEGLVAALLDLARALPAKADPAMRDLRTRLFGAAGQPVRLDPAVVRGLRASLAGSGGAASGASPDFPRRVEGFELKELLGRGGMGTVFRARQLDLRRDVALKLLDPGGDAEAAQRFLREARAVAALAHPHVVTCFASGRAERWLFTAFELLPGGDLDALVERRGALPEREALALARDAASGLAAIQDAGFVHRDVKPANIFLTADGRAKLGDLGLARSALGEDRVTRTGVAVGTPAYMAPEQLDGREVDIRADVYGLGATLFHLLAGEPPFHATSLSALARRAEEPPPDLRAKAPGTSRETVALVTKALAPAPRDRQRSAHALLDDLEDALAALERAEADAAARTARAARPRPRAAGARRRPAALGRRDLIIGAIAACTVGAGVGLWLTRDGGPWGRAPATPRAAAKNEARQSGARDEEARESAGDGIASGAPDRAAPATDAASPLAPPPGAQPGAPRPAEGGAPRAPAAPLPEGPAAPPVEGAPPPALAGAGAPVEPASTIRPLEPASLEPGAVEPPSASLDPLDPPRPAPTTEPAVGSPSAEPEPDREPELAPAPPAPPALAPVGPVRFRVQQGAAVTVEGTTYRLADVDAAWYRAGLFDDAIRALPLRARFRLEGGARRDSRPDVLAEQGFRAPAGFFWEAGVRGSASEVTAAAELTGFALWVTVVADTAGAAHVLVRALDPQKPAWDRALRVVGAPRTPGLALLDRFSLAGAFARGPLDVEMALDDRGYDLRFVQRGRALHRTRGTWAALPLDTGPALRGPLHLWGHLGHWDEGRGQGALGATTEPGR